MRRRILSFIALICLVSLTFFGLTSCGDDPKEPEKLVAPIVTLVDDIATWEANPNAEKFEISLSGELSYVENSYVSKKLTDGQTLKVRAIGDGVNYITSEWSNVVTYTAPQTHTHDFSAAWKKDATHHWHECSCGETDTKVAHSGGTATETQKAICEVCGQEYGDYKEPDHVHEATGDWKYDATHHWKECSCGAPDEKVAHSGGTATETQKAVCEVCGQEYGDYKQPDPHQHDFSGAWQKDATHHWHECTCGETDTKVAHSGGTATETEKAVCEICGASYGELKQHTHNYSENWKKDENNHWYECECGDKKDNDNHIDENNDSKCDVCDYQMSELTPAPQPNDGLSGTAITAIIISSVVVLSIGGFALVWFVLKKKTLVDLLAVLKK